MKNLFAFIASLLMAVAAIGQPNINTTEGRDFWVMFLYNAGDQEPHKTMLAVTGDSNATFTVTNPSTGWSTTRNLTANQAVEIEVPLSSTITSQCNSSQTKNYGLHVTSTANISLYAKNYKNKCNDVTLVYPTSTLGTHYIMQDYPTDPTHSPTISGAIVGFVATADYTVLTMILPCTLSNYSAYAGDTLTVNLMQGDSFQLIAAASGSGSFSGMEVTSNGNKFAAFQGNRVAYIPTGSGGADLLYEQAVPVNHWGNEFVVVSTAGRTADQVRITSSDDNCQIYSNGSLIQTLQKNETFEQTLSGVTARHYVCTKDVCVGKYLCSASSGGNPGDPSSVIIPPVDKGVTHITFSPIGNSEFSEYYINIVAHHSYVSGITLDGNNISNQFVYLDSAYRVAQISVSNTVHLLESPLGPVVAETYGLGSYASHAFTIARSFDIVNVFDTLCQGQSYDSLGLSLQGIHTQNAGNLLYDSYYMGMHYVFHLTVMPPTSSDVYDSIAMGDTMLWNGMEVTAAGEYTVTLTTATGCDSVVTLHITYIGSTEHLYDTLCVGTMYNGYGFATANPVMNDTVLTRDTVENEVPKRYVLHLNVLPTSLTQLNYTIIMGDTIGVCDTQLSVAGDYTFHYTNVHGCDSTVDVHLDYEAISLSASKDGICPGEEVTLTATGVHTYIWSSNPYDSELDAQQGMNPVTVHTMHTTVYSLLDEAGNIVATVTIGTDAAPTLCVEVNRDILDFDNPTLLFTDCSAGRYTTRWLFADGRQFTGERVRRRFNYPLPDSAIVTMTSCNRYNCCADTTIAIPMKINSVWFPNAFMPGADDNNLFQCFTSMDVAIFELVVYNRWGLLIWSSEDVNQGWDGRRTDGTPCPQGAYAYRYYLKATDGTVRTGTGTVTLLR